jgi:ADP-ribose pyrophosphatase
MPARKKSSVRVLSSKTVFRGRVFSVVTDQVAEPNGVIAQRDVIRHPGSIVVLAVDASTGNPRILLERQYRYAANAYMWELPAGRIDEGETRLAAAKRELLEETGYTAKKWTHALRFYASPGFLDETMDVYLAEKLIKGEAQPEEDERIATRLVPLEQAVHMVMTGKIADAKTMTSVLWFEKKRGQKNSSRQSR